MVGMTLFKNPEDWCSRARSGRAENPGSLGASSDAISFPQPFVVVSDASAWHSFRHTFRHTFRTLLDETGAPRKVQPDSRATPTFAPRLREGHGQLSELPRSSG